MEREPPFERGPRARRGSIDRTRSADAAFMLDVTLSLYLENSMAGSIPCLGYRSALDFQQMVTWMRVVEEEVDYGRSPTFEELIDDEWGGPYRWMHLKPMLVSRIEWGTPDQGFDDQRLLNEFTARVVAQAEGMTVAELFEAVVFRHNASFPKPKDWNIEGLDTALGGRTLEIGGERNERDPTGREASARADGTPAVGDIIEMASDAVLAELRDLAHRMLNAEPMPDGPPLNAQVVPVQPAVLLGVAATFEFLWSTPLVDIPEWLVNHSGHEPFHRIAARSLETFDPKYIADPDSRDTICKKCFQRLSDETKDFFRRKADR